VAVDVLEGPVLARCPSCRGAFPAERTGLQQCPLCGKALVVPEVPSVPPGGNGTPWENRERIGALRAFRETLVLALFEPASLFRAARLDRGAAQAGFAILTGSIFWIIGQLTSRLLLGPQLRRTIGQMDPSSLERKLLDTAIDSSPRTILLIVLVSPLLVLVLLYLNAAVTHVAALLLGQAKRGFPATFAACAYGFAPLVLLAVPGCGAPLALVWMAVLTAIGLKETHGISSAGAAAAVLAPCLFICCSACALGAAGVRLMPGVAQ
jgi:hypothetical protein